VASRMADTKAAKEMQVIEDFYQMLQSNPDRAW
jgi:hypothetical protein